MNKNLFASGGIILFLGSIGLGLFLFWGTLGAEGLDRVFSFALIGPCARVGGGVTFPSRVMSDSESQPLSVVFSNPETEECETSVSLSAPNFDISPSESVRTVKVPPGNETATIVWILSPRKLGTFTVGVGLQSYSVVYGITVTNILGLTASQAQLLAYAGSFLGPVLSVPWWYDRWKERRSGKTAKKSKQRKK